MDNEEVFKAGYREAAETILDGEYGSTDYDRLVEAKQRVLSEVDRKYLEFKGRNQTQ